MNRYAVLALASAMILASCADDGPAPSDTGDSRAADVFADHLSGVSLVTSDLDASVTFYTRYVGLIERGKRRTLSGQASLDVYGVSDGTPIAYTSLVPIGWPEVYPGHPGVSFAEIKTEQAALPGDQTRPPLGGETVLAFSVRDIKSKAAAMDEAGVPIVVPLAPSETGRSIAITVLDPNGMRVQLYEFVQ